MKTRLKFRILAVTGAKFNTEFRKILSGVMLFGIVFTAFRAGNLHMARAQEIAALTFSSIKLPFFNELSGKIIRGYGLQIPDNLTHYGSDKYALDICPDKGCTFPLEDIVIAPTNMRLELSLHGFGTSCTTGPEDCDYHIFTIAEEVTIQGQPSDICMSLGHFLITLPGFLYHKSVPRGAEIGRLVSNPGGIYYHIGLWYVPATGNCDGGNRVPLPFSGSYQLDGMPLDESSNHVGEIIKSSNIPLCAIPYIGTVNLKDRASIMTDGCLPPVEPPPSPDSATFISHITLPEGTVVSPGQSLTKTWRLNNTGTSTWGSGYQLVFRSGEQMGAPGAVNVPSTAPGQTADISVPMTSPTGGGLHVGNWSMRNPQGTYFGDPVWVKINISGSQPPSGNGVNVELVSITSPSSVSSGPTIPAGSDCEGLQWPVTPEPGRHATKYGRKPLWRVATRRRYWNR